MKPNKLTIMMLVIALLSGLAVGAIAGGNKVGMEAGRDGPGSGPCEPLTCEDLGVECGVWFDGCHKQIDCGTCDEGMTCVEGLCVEGSYWTVPTCVRIAGASEVTYTVDEGITLANTPRLSRLTYTYGLACLGVTDRILASAMTENANHVLLSEDAGCAWNEIRTLPAGLPLIVTPAPDGGAYLWSLNDRQIYRLIGSVVKTVQPPPVNIRGLAVDPNNAGHVRIGSRYCQIYDSYDWGLTWIPVGNPVEGAAITYEVDFDSLSWGSALCGSASGTWRTSNHGSTWEVAPPVNPEWGASDVVFTLARSPADPQRIWGQANVAVGNLDKHPMIIVSDDGGASFVSVVEQLETATDQNGIVRTLILPNQSLIAAHPEQPDVLYFVFGTYVENYGTDLWRYDKGTGTLSVVHIDDLDCIDAIAFNPADPGIMYLGLEYEDISLQKADGGAKAASGAVEVSVSPNPFNPTAEFKFSLGEPAHVKLDIFNIMGQKVGTLVNAHLSAGYHSVRWDGSEFASGVYVYRLKANETVKTDKMLLLK